MNSKAGERLVYSINVNDIQNVAKQILERTLTEKETALVEESLGEFVDWFGAIECAILKHMRN